ncbi:MAG: hypothetical protein AB1458_10930 [Bacteroidota bacterium]
MKHLLAARKKLIILLIHGVGLPVLVRFRKPKPWHYSHEELRRFPEGTWGKALADTLDKKGYRLLRNYEYHDAKHVLLGYGMDEVSEVRMQFFFLGNRRYSFPVLSTVITGMLLMPERWGLFLDEFRKGRSLPPVNRHDIARMVTEPLAEVRARLLTSNQNPDKHAIN